jgi:hypothetical protein
VSTSIGACRTQHLQANHGSAGSFRKVSILWPAQGFLGMCLHSALMCQLQLAGVTLSCDAVVQVLWGAPQSSSRGTALNTTGECHSQCFELLGLPL